MATNEELSPSVTEELSILSSDELQLLSIEKLAKIKSIVQEEINNAISTKNDIRYNYLTAYKQDLCSVLTAKKESDMVGENK